MTNIKTLHKFVHRNLSEIVEGKEDPSEWYVLLGSAVGEYSVQTAEMPPEYEESEAELPPEDRDATKNVDGFYQIGASGWTETAFTDDCNFVGTIVGRGHGIDTRLMHCLLVHKDKLSEEALAVANGEDTIPGERVGDWDRDTLGDGVLYDLYSILADATEAASTGDPNTVSAKAAEAKRLIASLSERFQACDECGHPVDTELPGVGKSPNDERWWHPNCGEGV